MGAPIYTRDSHDRERACTSISVIPQVGDTAVRGYRPVVGLLTGLSGTADSEVGQGLFTVRRYRPANGTLAGLAHWSSCGAEHIVDTVGHNPIPLLTNVWEK